ESCAAMSAQDPTTFGGAGLAGTHGRDWLRALVEACQEAIGSHEPNGRCDRLRSVLSSQSLDELSVLEIAVPTVLMHQVFICIRPDCGAFDLPLAKRGLNITFSTFRTHWLDALDIWSARSHRVDARAVEAARMIQRHFADPTLSLSKIAAELNL